MSSTALGSPRCRRCCWSDLEAFACGVWSPETRRDRVRGLTRQARLDTDAALLLPTCHVGPHVRHAVPAARRAARRGAPRGGCPAGPAPPPRAADASGAPRPRVRGGDGPSDRRSPARVVGTGRSADDRPHEREGERRDERQHERQDRKRPTRPGRERHRLAPDAIGLDDPEELEQRSHDEGIGAWERRLKVVRRPRGSGSDRYTASAAPGPGAGASTVRPSPHRLAA